MSASLAARTPPACFPRAAARAGGRRACTVVGAAPQMSDPMRYDHSSLPLRASKAWKMPFVVTGEHQTRRGGHHTRQRRRRQLELPLDRAGLDVERAHGAVVGLGQLLHPAAHEHAADHRLLLDRRVDRARFAGHHEEQLQRRIVGRRIEVGAAAKVGDARRFLRIAGHHGALAQHDRLAVGAELARPLRRR